jgi:D-xylose transport system substrate-binding protein
MILKTVFRRSTVLALVALATASLAVFIVANATASTKKKTASVQVCVLLPDTKSSVRWVQFDAPDLKAAFKKAGVTASINNALNDPLKQKAQAQACIAAGATVVIETALDNGSAASIEKLFTSKGGFAIDYDRQVTGGSASVYEAFDGVAVGAAQAKGVLAAMKANGTYSKNAVLAQLWGGQTDQNAYWFQSGNLKILNPLFKVRAIKRGPQQFVPDWDANNAATIFSQMLVKTNNNIQGIVAANDNIAGAVIADLKAKHLKPIPLSGQDASAAGVQNIISGWQTGTVYKYVPAEANAAAAAAVALLKGKKPVSNSTRPNGKKPEPTNVLPVIWITKANYKLLFQQKWLKRSDVCIGEFKQYCK